MQSTAHLPTAATRARRRAASMRCIVARASVKAGMKCDGRRGLWGVSTRRRRAQRTQLSDWRCRLTMPLQTVLTPPDLC